MYSPISRLEGRDSIRLIFRARWPKQARASSRAPGWLAWSEKRQAGQLPIPIAFTTAQQQEAGAVPGNVIDRVSQHLEAMLLCSLLGGDGSAEATALDHPSRLCGGAGGQLQCRRGVLAQPEAALRQGLGMGEHFADPIEGATAHQGMADRQDQGPGNLQFRMLPESIHAGGDAPFNRVLNRHHSRVGAASR